jgi:hypothetical protein
MALRASTYLAAVASLTFTKSVCPICTSYAELLTCTLAFGESALHTAREVDALGALRRTRRQAMLLDALDFELRFGLAVFEGPLRGHHVANAGIAVGWMQTRSASVACLLARPSLLLSLNFKLHSHDHARKEQASSGQRDNLAMEARELVVVSVQKRADVRRSSSDRPFLARPF